MSKELRPSVGESMVLILAVNGMELLTRGEQTGGISRMDVFAPFGPAIQCPNAEYFFIVWRWYPPDLCACVHMNPR